MKTNAEYMKEYHNKIDFGGLKPLVLQRDNYRCISCGLEENYHLEMFGRGLIVHHKNHNKKDNTIGNLEALCCPCHGSHHREDPFSEERMEKSTAGGYASIKNLNAWHRAKTHCPHGHEYTIENTYYDGRNARNCRICMKTRWRK